MKKVGKNLLMLIVFNSIVGVLVTFAISKSLQTSMGFSHLIGFSVYTFMRIPIRLNAPHPPPLWAIAFTITVGTGFGLLAGILIFEPENVGVLVLLSREWMIIIFVSLLFSIAGALLFISKERATQMKLNLQAEKLKTLEAEKLLAKSSLKLLQSQIEPHFLFNTLSNLLTLISKDPPKARVMLEHLTEYFRATLSQSQKGICSLEQEFSMLESYLEIQIIRMGDRVKYQIDAPEDLKGFLIPPLLVQPLVENAISHGLEKKVGGGELTIVAKRTEEFLLIEVTDTGVGLEYSPKEGVGLKNVKERLQADYGDRASLSLRQNTPSGLIATISIPYDLLKTS